MHTLSLFSWLMRNPRPTPLLLTILIIECTGSIGSQHVDNVFQHLLLVVIKLDFLHQKKLYEKTIANKMSRAFIQSSAHLIVYNKNLNSNPFVFL